MPIGFMYDIFIPKIYWIWAYIRKKGLVGHGIFEFHDLRMFYPIRYKRNACKYSTPKKHISMQC